MLTNWLAPVLLLGAAVPGDRGSRSLGDVSGGLVDEGIEIEKIGRAVVKFGSGAAHGNCDYALGILVVLGVWLGNRVLFHLKLGL